MFSCSKFTLTPYILPLNTILFLAFFIHRIAEWGCWDWEMLQAELKLVSHCTCPKHNFWYLQLWRIIFACRNFLLHLSSSSFISLSRLRNWNVFHTYNLSIISLLEYFKYSTYYFPLIKSYFLKRLTLALFSKEFCWGWRRVYKTGQYKESGHLS